MATSTLIQFTRGDGYLSDAFPQLPAATDVPMYDGVTIIKDISSGTPWVNSLTNQLFVGNACINPFLEASDPISVTADYYVGGTTPDDAYIATKLQLNSNSNHFSISNGVLNLNLDSSDFITNSSGVHINWPTPTTYTLPSANTTTLGGIKPSWSGVVTDLEDVFDHKATTIAALATSENKYYPVISDPSSLLNITNDYPYSLFETAAARDGRLYTVTRPATRKFSGAIKVSPPLSGNNSTDMFPGTGITFTFLDGSSTGNVGIHTKNAYLARLTNRADLLSNNVVDLDTLLGQSAYPSASNQTLAQRDSLFETFVPIPWPSTAHPGISKISGGNSFSIGNLITPTGSYIYPIGITTTNQLVAQLPNVLVASDTVPSSGDLVLYDPNEGWDPRKPARLTLKVNNTQVASYGVEDSTDTTVNIDVTGKADKVSNATNGNFAALDSNGNLTDSGAKDSDYVHITGAETITGVKKFTQPVTMQNGSGPGSLIFGADVNAGTLTHNTRKLGRINSPTEDVRNGLTATLLGWDTQGNLADDMHTANRNYDTVSFGGMKKISTNTSPMNIVFCVTKKRNSRVPADKVYPIEMDANEVRFNVLPNYVGNRLLNTTDILDSTSSTATDKAATSNAVKSAYDLAAAAIPKSLGTAAGDIIYYTANGTPARLAKGTTGQVLTINSGATAPEWTDVPTELPALTNNANKILAVNSSATGVEWITNSGGGGTVSHDYTHSSVSVVSTSTTTVTFAANQKCTKYISVSDDIDIAFAVNNFASNYLWVINTSNNDIDVTFSLASNSTLGTILNYHMPEDPLTISAGKEAEIGIIVNADGAFITYRSDLVKTSFLQATVNVSSSNSSYGTATLTGGPTYTFESGSTQSVTMTASPASECFFIKWQSSSNGTTWTDISGGTNPTLTTTLNASGTYYYKAVFSTGTSISAVEARILTPNGSSEAKVFLGNNYEDSITVSPGTTIYLSTDGYPIDFSYTSYPDLSNYSDFVVGYEYSTNNGSTWNFVSINDSSFSAGSIATIVRPIVASEVYLMELTATSMGDSSMGTIGSDSVSIDVSVEGNSVSSPTLDYYNANLYIPVFDGESIYFTASFSPCSQPGNFYVGDSQGNSVSLDSYGSTSEQIYFGDVYDYGTGTQWTTDSCSGSLTVGYDENPDPNDPNDPNNPGGGY